MNYHKFYGLAVLAIMIAYSSQQTFTSSLSDCNTFAAMFDNTCDPTKAAPAFGSIPYKAVNCYGAGRCAGRWSNWWRNCTWWRQLCVTCKQNNTGTFVRAQTNGFPDHCYSSPRQKPYASYVDFEVLFQWDVGQNVYHTATTQAQINSLICNIQQSADANIPAAAKYARYGWTNIDTAVGVSMTGVMMYNAQSANNVDPFFPAVYGSIKVASAGLEYVDTCLMHPEMEGHFHYHMMPPCVADRTLAMKTQGPCCGGVDIRTYATQHLHDNGYNKIKPLGIAKDGHIVYGPYKAPETLYAACDLDVCNGAMIGGVYGYVATQTHPYFVGCWGPGNSPTNLAHQCSQNARKCVA